MVIRHEPEHDPDGSGPKRYENECVDHSGLTPTSKRVTTIKLVGSLIDLPDLRGLMRLYVEPRELLFLDGLLQNLVVERDMEPAAFTLAGKVKRLIGTMVEAIPNEPAAA